MKLVHDADNVSNMPIRNLNDIATMARGFGDDVENGEWGSPRRAIVVVQDEHGGLSILGWGENTEPLELMGLFEAAKLNVFADHVVDD